MPVSLLVSLLSSLYPQSDSSYTKGSGADSGTELCKQTLCRIAHPVAKLRALSGS